MSVTAPAVPVRSLEQRMQNLEKANEIRLRRVQLKRDLKNGRRTDIVGLIERPPEWLRAMNVAELLLALPRVGQMRVNRTLTACVIAPSKTVGGLSPRQRAALLARLSERGGTL